MRFSYEYDDVAKVIIQIYLDYDIKDFPIDLHDVCHRLGVTLVPYSKCPAEAKKLREIKSFCLRRPQKVSLSGELIILLRPFITTIMMFPKLRSATQLLTR